MTYMKSHVFIRIAYTVDWMEVIFCIEEHDKSHHDVKPDDGGDGTNTDGELGELHLSAISEAMNR